MNGIYRRLLEGVPLETDELREMLDLSDALPLLKRPRTILAGSIARVGGL